VPGLSENSEARSDGFDAENGDALFAQCQDLVNQLFTESRGEAWGLSAASFALALQRSAAKKFPAETSSVTRLTAYLSTLHVRDLALAAACSRGYPPAWDHFVAGYRGYLRAAAAAILRCPETAPEARDLADSLFADLYGLRDGEPSERSLFRYFHGRSSLKTWLRAVMAQRYVDAIRASRRYAQLDDENDPPNEATVRHAQNLPTEQAKDPHRERYVALFSSALEVELNLLPPSDRERLRLYYAEDKTLAEIGRKLGEHESSVSRSLERIRRHLRLAVEEALRKGRSPSMRSASDNRLSDAEIAVCFEYAAEDVPIDFDRLFPRPIRDASASEKQEP
jgi:RNA polymerase sigma factor (sigma-70 family)